MYPDPVAMSLRELEAAKSSFVCQECLGDPMVKRLQGTLFYEKICMACGERTANVLDPEHIAAFIKEALPNYYEVDYGLYNVALNLEQLVGREIRCTNESVCKAIAAHLVDPETDEEDFYWPGQQYLAAPSPFESAEHERWFVVGDWDHIAHELKHGQRFFNDKVRLFFEELIAEALDARIESSPDNCAVVSMVPSGAEFFRARLANDMGEVKKFQENPASELGAPPKEVAANNRMSPAGIPLLYVAGDPYTAIAEVRPSMHDLVAVGRFMSKRTLKFFDFTALSGRVSYPPLSIFDPKYEDRAMRRRLLSYLHKEIAKPIRSGDTDYLVTQALAEFIRHEKNQDFDGIMFQSVQRDQGTNYVLFDKTSTLSDMFSPEWRAEFGLEISYSDVTIYKITSLSYQVDKKNLDMPNREEVQP
jgi:hypothetical protein